jgi:hypothetical protein
MRFPILITTCLVLGAALAAPGAQAAPSGTAYDVTVTGLLNYEKTYVDIPSTRPRECNDTKGTEVDRTKAAWKSQTALRVKIFKRDGRFQIYPVGGGRGSDWDLRVNMIHSGSSDRQVKARGCEAWTPLPPPEEENCIKTMTNWGGNLGPKTVRKNGTVAFTGGEDVSNPGNPFDGCPWGDHSLGLYSSKGKINPEAILNSVASEVWLKSKGETKSGVPGGDTTTIVTSTSVRLLFKRVKPGS